MAITYKGGHEANYFTPAYNQVNYYFDSDNKNEDGFRYVVDVYKFGTSTKIWEGRIAPRSADGFAFVPLQGVLKNHVSHETELNLEVIPASKSWYRFEMKIGEEFIKKWEYTDYEVYDNTGSPYHFYTQLRQFTASPALAHSYSVGDQIDVTQSDGGALKPILTGLHTVVEVVDAYTIVIELPFSAVGSGAAVAGEVKYADNRKTITRDLLATNATVYNGALGNKEFLNTNSDTFVIAGNSTNRRMLTNFPSEGFRATLTQKIRLNFVNYFSSASAYIYFENDNGDVLRKVTNVSTADAITQVEVGASVTGLELVSGTAPLIKADTKSYRFYVAFLFSGIQLTKSYTIELDRRCKINDTEVSFLDRLGSLPSFAFQIRQVKQVQVNKESYTKRLGELTYSGRVGYWGYTDTEGGDTTTGVTIEEDYTLRTNWITDAQSVYFEELVSSPFTIMRLNGEFHKVSVRDTSVVVEREKNKGLIKKQITVRLSNQTNINA